MIESDELRKVQWLRVALGQEREGAHPDFEWAVERVHVSPSRHRFRRSSFVPDL
ncbi:hypothetical protein GCM10009612_72750 [Streptomyces beijiangensis]